MCAENVTKWAYMRRTRLIFGGTDTVSNGSSPQTRFEVYFGLLEQDSLKMCLNTLGSELLASLVRSASTAQKREQP